MIQSSRFVNVSARTQGSHQREANTVKCCLVHLETLSAFTATIVNRDNVERYWDIPPTY